ncbi:phosphoserine aminotransferase [Reticulomyxa filosa]|uniref:phosphoserine transaminase n=1 Tax=Reticulomyxa filosa TaxID=46433 RepID=X6N0F1_RETFI|nr:phosphoserine aminotransferase [Reticulomyxa filosa]|eukprot:ETO19219.1 phosphoserine aminotransferase [Reticulomyxa filosa]
MAENEKKTERVANFSAGPAVLPEEVLLEAQKDLFSYKGKGLSVLEMSHRSKEFEQIWNDARADIIELLNKYQREKKITIDPKKYRKIPKNYKVLFLQGGGTLQFSAVPLNFNLANSNKPADYVVTGQWSKKACEEAKRFGNVNVVCNTTKTNPPCVNVPPLKEWKLSEDALYLHVCINETVHGVMMHEIPEVKCPIVADFSSCFMSEPIDVSNYCPRRILGKADPKCPIYCDWKTEATTDMYNTPPCFSAYIMGLVFKWLKNTIGGLEKMHELNLKKAKVVYDVVDEDDFYHAPVEKRNRSLMNIRFHLKGGEQMDALFVKEATALGLQNLKGYRDLGGIRVSTYNAQPYENCVKVAKFMRDFRKQHSK